MGSTYKDCFEELIRSENGHAVSVSKLCSCLLDNAHYRDKNKIIERLSSESKADLVLKLCEKYSEMDLERYRILALLRLEKTSDAARLAVEYCSRKRSDYVVRRLLNEVTSKCMQKADFNSAILISNLRIKKYNDIDAYNCKAEALMKIWQIDSAIDCLENANSVLIKNKLKTRMSDELYQRKLNAVKRKLTDYRNKKYRGYKYFPDNITARNRLYSTIEMTQKAKYSSFLICDNKFDADSFVAVDLEFTPSKGMEKIIEIGAVKVKNGDVVGFFSQLVNPNTFVTNRVSTLTGITNDMLIGKPSIKKVFKNFIDFSEGLPFLAHDATTDVCLLLQLSEMYCVKIDSSRCIDTLLLAKELFKDKNHYSLDYLASEFDIKQYSVHRAFSDALTATKLYFYMKNKVQNDINYYMPLA